MRQSPSQQYETLRAAAIADLLRVYHPTVGFLASGSGRFTAYFGRDAALSIILSLSKPENARVPGLLEAAIASQRLAASLQGKTFNPLTEEAPGKFPHEFHDGTSPQDRLLQMREDGWPVYTNADNTLGMIYYGAGDTTALFTISVAVVTRLLGRQSLAARNAYLKEFWPHVRAGIKHDIEIGDLDHDELIESSPQNASALLNHTWKDSHDAYRREDSSLPPTPYKYLNNNCYYLWSLREAAWLARLMGESAFGQELRQRYTLGVAKLHDVFWNEEESYFSPLIDGYGQPVHFISDDVLDGLWGGIFYNEQAYRVIERLRQPDINTPRGLRTRSSMSRQFRVNGARAYHNGLIWPHRNRIAAEGMENYGVHDFAQELDAKMAKIEIRHGRVECVAVGRNGRLSPYQEQGVSVACKPQSWVVHGALARTANAGGIPLPTNLII